MVCIMNSEMASTSAIVQRAHLKQLVPETSSRDKFVITYPASLLASNLSMMSLLICSKCTRALLLKRNLMHRRA